MFSLFPGVINPVFTTNPQHEFYPWGPNLLGLILLTFASALEVFVVITAVPMFLILPGPVSVCIFYCWPDVDTRSLLADARTVQGLL
jgi:hypothetical protein